MAGTGHGGSALFEAEIGKYLLEGKAVKSFAAGESWLAFHEVETKKAANWAAMKELKGQAGKGYPERLALNNSLLKMAVEEQEGAVGEAGKGARLKNTAEAVVFSAVPGTVENPKVKYASIVRYTAATFEKGELLYTIEVNPEVTILETTTKFSFATGELDFEIL